MQYWLMKTEPTEFSIYDLEKLPNKTVEWFGIRNYQARNFIRDSIKIGDQAFFWHSFCKHPGIYGVVEIVSKPYFDTTQFNPGSKYYDPMSEIKPRWYSIDVRLVKITDYISISKLRQCDELVDLQVLKRGNRLSVSPVSQENGQFINNLIA